MKKNFRETYMIKRNRKGVIGFLLTMAVGVALGAAALVVTSEMGKEKKADPLKAAKVKSSPVEVEKAFEEYQKAYRAYQQAAGLGRKDIQKYADAYHEAKRRLEIEIFRNTPGVSDMDMDKFEPDNSSDGKDKNSSQAAPSSETSSDEVVNPFADNQIVLTEKDYSAGQNQAQNSEQTAIVSTSSATSTSGNSSAADTSGASVSDNQITGMDYYQVKSGDSLSKICQRYYGDSGMWAHILKYQIPSVAATPNLIFPGQLIALPRGLTQSKGEDSHISSSEVSSGSSSGTSSGSDSSGQTYKIAPAGDESWQSRFQKDYLISDHSLTNTNTMTVADIQRFLDSKGSCLAKPYRGSTPAKMIFDAAKKYGINPQVLLCRLQCEQGLISKKSATQKQLDWAVGVGCYDSGNWNQKFKGLDKQIEFAAATYRRHFDHAKSRLDKGEKISMTIDGQSVTVKNAASYSFYKYCPHFQGNKLFYDVWNGYRKNF